MVAPTDRQDYFAINYNLPIDAAGASPRPTKKRNLPQNEMGSWRVGRARRRPSACGSARSLADKKYQAERPSEA